jgi:glycosyltransferase involved in cell wall biosynthesis
MAPLLSIADVLLLPSESESFGLVALEAMASEVPVIATDVGGLPEVIEEGKDGFLCKVGDVSAMAEAGIRLLEQPALRLEMALAARAHASRDFSADKIVLAYEDLYRRTIDTAKSSTSK